MPNVVRLQLHLEGEHSVTFCETSAAADVQNIANAASSTLLAYFKECAKTPSACQYLYQEFPQHYVWDKKKKTWSPRKQGFAIGRIYYTPPKSG